MIQKNLSGIGDKMEHSEDSHVEKIWHNSDITKNWNPEVAEIFLQDLVMYYMRQYMRHSSYVRLWGGMARQKE